MVEADPLDPIKMRLASFHTKRELWSIYVELCGDDRELPDKNYFYEIWRKNFPNLGTDSVIILLLIFYDSNLQLQNAAVSWSHAIHAPN